jgi:hypothetical protein
MSSSATNNPNSSSSAANDANASLNGGGDNATEAAADDDSFLPNVVVNSLFAKTKSAYESAPLAYAAGATAINWTGTIEAREKAIARVEVAFGDVDVAGDWSTEGTKAYKHLLNKHYEDIMDDDVEGQNHTCISRVLLHTCLSVSPIVVPRAGANHTHTHRR